MKFNIIIHSLSRTEELVCSMRSFFIFLWLSGLFLCTEAQNADSLVFEFLPVADAKGLEFGSDIGRRIERDEWSCLTDEDTLELRLFYNRLYLNDFDLKDYPGKRGLTIDDSSLFYFTDSVLYTGDLVINLPSKVIFCEEVPLGFGDLMGKVINGRKEQEWVERYYSVVLGEMVVIKRMNYKRGQLHGDYFVYTQEGEVIPYQDYVGEATAATSTFENGTGLYVDFYNFPPYQLKVHGRLVNGKKDGRWQVYDKDGDIIVSYIYQNGIIVNF